MFGGFPVLAALAVEHVKPGRRGGRADEAATIKGTRWALLKNPQRLSAEQRTTLAGIQTTNGPLYRASLLKMRHEAPRRIPSPAGRNLEGGFWI